MIGIILSILIKIVFGIIAFFVIGLILAIMASGGGGGSHECNTDNIDWDEYDKAWEMLHPGCTRDMEGHEEIIESEDIIDD